MLTKLYLVRHGQTDWNAQSRIQGHHQTSLNDLGREQARRVAAHLQTCGIELLYSSDLDRALQTAEAIAEATGVPIAATTPALRERDFGPLTGMSISEARRKRDEANRVADGETESVRASRRREPAEEHRVDESGPGELRGLTPPARQSEKGEWSVVDTWGAVAGVESDAAMSERVWSFLRPLPERHAGRTVLVVTHGGVLKTVMYGVLGIQPQQPWRGTMENTAVNLFEIEGGIWRLRMFGFEPG